MSNEKARESFWVRSGQILVLVFPLSALSIVLRGSGVSDLAIVAILVLVPVATSLVPYFARRWSTWGQHFCFVCPLVAYIAFSKDKHWGWGSILGVALVSGITALCLKVVTGAITKRRSEVA